MPGLINSVLDLAKNLGVPYDVTLHTVDSGAEGASDPDGAVAEGSTGGTPAGDAGGAVPVPPVIPGPEFRSATPNC